jgi:hypothetical protein
MAVVAVNVTDCRTGTAPLTWGQGGILRILTMLGDQAVNANLGTSADLPAGTDVPTALMWIQHLLTTYDALRTRYVDRDGTLVQLLDGAGSVDVELVESGDRPVSEIMADLRGSRFAIADEWPIRFTIVRQGIDATTIVFACSHTVADAWGIRVFRAALCRPGSTLDPGVQPLDQAAFELSSAGRTVDARANAYWRAQLSAMPQTLFPGVPRKPCEGYRYWYASFESPLVAAALPSLAHRYGRTTSAVLHAAFSAALATNASTDSCPMGIVASNRTRVGTKNSIGSYSQLVPITLPVKGRSWEELIRGAANATLSALRNGAYHPTTRTAVTEEVEHERGVPLDLSLWFNDTRSAVLTEEGHFDPLVPPARGVAEWGNPTNEGDSTVFVYVNGKPDRAGMYVMFDTTRLSLADSERLLADVEQGLLEAAGDAHRGGAPTSVRWRPSNEQSARVDGPAANTRR